MPWQKGPAVNVTRHTNSWRFFVSICVGILSAQALSLRNISDTGYTGFHELASTGLDSMAQLGAGGGFLLAAGLSVLFYLLLPFVCKANRRERWTAGIVSAVLSLTIVYSREIPRAGSQTNSWPDYITASFHYNQPVFFIVFILQLLAICPILAAILCWLKSICDRVPTLQTRQTKGAMVPAPLLGKVAWWRRVLVVLDGKSLHLLAGTVLIFICWAPVMLICGRATVGIDAILQLIQFKTGHAWDPMTMKELPGYVGQDHHPFLDTFLYGFFYDVGVHFGSAMAGMRLLVILQALVAAFSLVMALTWIRRRTRLPDLSVFLLLCFVAFMPAFPMHMVQILKDMTWVPFFLLWMIAFFEIVYRCLCEQDVGWKLMTAFIALAVVSGLTKKTGVYVTTLSLLVLAVFMRKRSLTILTAAFLPALLVLVLVPSVVLPAIGYAPGGKQESLSVPIQQVSKVVIDHGKDIAPQDRAVIDRVLDVEAIGPHWTSFSTDNAKHYGYKVSSTSGDRAEFLKVWVKLFFRFPRDYVSAVGFLADFSSLGYTYYVLDPIRCGWWEAGGQDLFEDYQECALNYTQEKVALPMKQALNKTPPFSFMGSVSLYVVWLPFITIALAIMQRRYKAFYLLIPFAVSWLILLASPTFASRYSIAFLFCSVLTCAIPFVFQSSQEKVLQERSHGTDKRK